MRAAGPLPSPPAACCISVTTIRCLNPPVPFQLSPDIQYVYNSMLATLTKEFMLSFFIQRQLPQESFFFCGKQYQRNSKYLQKT